MRKFLIKDRSDKPIRKFNGPFRKGVRYYLYNNEHFGPKSIPWVIKS